MHSNWNLKVWNLSNVYNCLRTSRIWKFSTFSQSYLRFQTHYFGYENRSIFVKQRQGLPWIRQERSILQSGMTPWHYSGSVAWRGRVKYESTVPAELFNDTVEPCILETTYGDFSYCFSPEMKFGRLITSIKFYKMCNFENQILWSDIIMAS